MFEVPHPAGPRRLSALPLLSPLVGTQFRTRVPTLRAFCTEKRLVNAHQYNCMSQKRTLVLLVERTIAAATTECMRLGMALTSVGIRRATDGTMHDSRDVPEGGGTYESRAIDNR